VPLELFAVFSFFLVPGFQLASTQFRRDHSYVHLVSLSMLLSVAINSLTLYLVGLAGALNLWSVLLVFAMTNAGALLIFRGFMLNVFRTKPVFPNTCSVPLAVVITMISLGLMINAASWPFAWWDALATFNPVALYLLRIGTTARFVLPGYVPGSPGNTWYSLGFPLTLVWGYLMSGSLDENVAHAMTPFFMLILLGYSYLLSKQLGASGIVAAFLVVISPIVLQYTLGGYADVSAAAFFLAMAFYATRWMSGHSRIDLIFSALSAALAAWMKPQGLLAVAALPTLLLVTTLIMRRDRGNILMTIKNIGILLLAEITFLPMYVYIAIVSGPGLFLEDLSAYLSWNWTHAAELQNAQQTANLTTVHSFLGVTTPVAVQTLFRGELVQQSPVLVSLLLVGVIFCFLRRSRVALFPTLLAFGYFGFWFVTSPASERYLISFFALAFPLTAVMLSGIDNVLKKPGRRRTVFRKAYALLLVLLVIGPTLSAVQFSIQGYGPTIDWSLTHLNSPVNEKREFLMGSMWRIANFAQTHHEISDAGTRVLVTDSRIRDWVLDATYAPSLPWASNLVGACYYRYVITQDDLSSQPGLNITLIHRDLDWKLYKVDCT
jgi:hypothetical protein